MHDKNFLVTRRIFLGGILVTACGVVPSGGGGSSAKAEFQGGETILHNHDGIPAINRFRQKHGASDLVVSEACSQAALQQAHYMARTAHVDHNVPGVGSLGNVATRLRHFGVPKPHGENLSWGYRNAERAAAGWYGSPGHHETMINPSYRYAGMAMAKHTNSDGVIYWCSVYSA